MRSVVDDRRACRRSAPTDATAPLAWGRDMAAFALSGRGPQALAPMQSMSSSLRTIAVCWS